jgi:hypothetical protein
MMEVTDSRRVETRKVTMTRFLAFAVVALLPHLWARAECLG